MLGTECEDDEREGSTGGWGGGGGWKIEKYFIWKILSWLCMTSETSEVPLVWNEIKNVPALYKCQIKFIKK